MQKRRQQLIEHIFRNAPVLEPMFKHAKAVTFHQDKFAPQLSDDELNYLGAIVKVAGFYGVSITLTGQCGEVPRSGDNAKD